MSGHPFAVKRIALEGLGEERIGGTEPVVGLVDRLVGHCVLAFAAHEGSRQGFGALRVVDEAVHPGAGAGDLRVHRGLGVLRSPSGRGHRRIAQPLGPQVATGLIGDLTAARGAGGSGELLASAFGDRIEQVRRNDVSKTHMSRVPPLPMHRIGKFVQTFPCKDFFASVSLHYG